MATRLNPYLALPGTARDAVLFYADVFGGTPSIMTFGDAGAAGPGGPDPEHVMHASLETPAGMLMLSDMPPGMPQERGNDVSLSLSGDEDAVLRGWWARLSEGGEVTVPLEKQMWGDVFGACRDRFGVSWMVDIGEPQG